MIFLKFWKNAVLFYLGGMGYVGLELLWRRRSHSSMFVLGGICFLALGKLDEAARKRPLPLRLAAGSGIITSLELLAGILVNRRHEVWDYSSVPCNYLGQICLPYTLLWVPVAGFAMWLHRKLRRAMFHSTVF